MRIYGEEVSTPYESEPLGCGVIAPGIYATKTLVDILRPVFNDRPLNLFRKSGSFFDPKQPVKKQSYEKELDMQDTLLATLYTFVVEKIFEIILVIELWSGPTLKTGLSL